MLRGGSPRMCLERMPRAKWIEAFVFVITCFSFNLVNYPSFTRLLFHQYWMSFTTAKISSRVHQAVRRPIPFVPVRLCVSGFERSTCEPVADETDVRPAETFAKYGKGSYGPNRFGPLGMKTLEKLSRGKGASAFGKHWKRWRFQTTCYISTIISMFCSFFFGERVGRRRKG